MVIFTLLTAIKFEFRSLSIERLQTYQINVDPGWFD